MLCKVTTTTTEQVEHNKNISLCWKRTIVKETEMENTLDASHTKIKKCPLKKAYFLNKILEWLIYFEKFSKPLNINLVDESQVESLRERQVRVTFLNIQEKDEILSKSNLLYVPKPNFNGIRSWHNCEDHESMW